MKKLTKYLCAILLALTAVNAHAIPLSDLFAGASITVGDKNFDDWEELNNEYCPSSICNSGGLNTSQIDVTGVGDGTAGNEYGLQFSGNGVWRAIGDEFLGLWFRYSVQVLDPTISITASSMTGTISTEGDEHLIVVEKDISEFYTSDHLAFIEIYSDPFDAPPLDLADDAGVGSQSKIWVEDNVFVDGFGGFSELFEFTQRFVQGTIAAPDIDIEKSTNGVDADDPNAGDAPNISPGDLVTWTYQVTNTGDVPLDNVIVTDDQGVAVSCPQTTLSPGESMICSASGIAEDLFNTGFTTVPGLCGAYPNRPLYENIGTAQGEAPSGQFIDDTDPSHYCNPVNPGIDIEKFTNGVDADDPNAGDAPNIAPGDLVTWTYVVTNTGDVPLVNVVVIDDQGVAVSCPQNTLSPGHSMICSASGIAERLVPDAPGTVPGMCGDDTGPLYENTGSASAEFAALVADDTDPSHYCNPRNRAPVAVTNSYSHDEDTQLSGNVIADETGAGVDSDADGDVMSMSSFTPASHGTVLFNADNSGSFTYDPIDDYCGDDMFTYVITDDPSATWPSMTSNTARVYITVECVNDPPVVSSISPASQTSDYSDYIGTVVITVTDIDDVSTDLAESDEPPASAAGLSLASTGCTLDNSLSPNPAEDGSICTWDYDGQVIDPGTNVHYILFTPADGDGPNTDGAGTHTLNIHAEDATVMLDSANAVAVEVPEADDPSGVFTLMFSAWETYPADSAHDGSPEFGDLNTMVPIMTLVPVGPGGPEPGTCTFIDPPLPVYPGEGYGQRAIFECVFDEVPVNTYEILAQVDGASDTTIYYAGSDEGVLVVYDPSLGFTTGGGWFYWPATEETGYPGDKTNIGFNIKYNKKQTNIQGSLLLMRHTITGETYKVKSNALDGLSIGSGTDDAGDYGWAAFGGKSTFRSPGTDNEGNQPFLVYIEDHGEQGCNQDPADEFWIEVKDKDGNIVLEVNGPDSDPAGENAAIDGDDEPIECGNIVVPHKQGGGGGKKKRP